MARPFRATPHRSVAGVVRHWLTRTFSGRAFQVALVLKLLFWALRLGGLAAPALETADAVVDLTLLLALFALGRRLFLDLRGLLLWRVRRKLTLSYIFIGVVPVLLSIVFFLAAGLILFFNVSQYVAVRGVTTVVEHTTFLAESAATGLQGASSLEEIRARLERRLAGASRTFPFLSYAVVPVDERVCTGRATVEAGAPVSVDQTMTVGAWQHVVPPTGIPAWIDCEGTSGLVAYTAASLETSAPGATIDVQMAARSVAWPEDPTPTYAVVVDVPLSDQLRDRIEQDTSVEIADVAVVLDACLPLPGRRLDTARPDGDPEPRALLSRPIEWVAFLPYLDWERGDACRASMNIRTTLGGLYTRISATATTANNEFTIGTIILWLLALVGVLFLLIQIAALIMGLALARSITASVHELFTGTERVRVGDFTHKIAVTSRDQLGELAESFNSMTASIADLLQQKAEKERMEQELRIARDIQMSLLPRDPATLPGLSVMAHCEPAREVGGDYYDYMTLDDHRLALLIADVAGKGTSAALYMAELKGVMLSLSNLHTSPRQLLIDANRIISKHLDSKSFITITYAVVDVNAGTLTYARAGHCPMVYVPGPYAPSRAARILVPDGLVLGLQIDEGQRFSHLLEEATVQLGLGDVFLFYTDGLTEAMDEEGECFGDGRLAAIVQEGADLPFPVLRERILSEIAAFSASTGQQDDMTLLLLRVESIGASAAADAGVR